MARNITLKIDDDILKKCRFAAVEEDKSLSRWISELLGKTMLKKGDLSRSRKRALARLKKGVHLGGASPDRNSLYERR